MKSDFNPNEPLVLFQRTDRLGARIEGMLSAWRFARATRRKLIVYWPDRKPAGKYDPSFFFDLKAMADAPGTADLSICFGRFQDIWGDQPVTDLRRARGWPFFLRKKDYTKAGELPVKIVTEHSTYFCFRWESPWRVIRELKALYASLVPSLPIREALVSAMSWIGEEEFVAVHIRRGDVISKIRRTLKNFMASAASSENFAREVEKLKKEGVLELEIKFFVQRVTSIDAYIAALPRKNRRKIVIFSDTPEAAADFQAHLGKDDRSVLMSSFQAELDSEQRAFLELLVLAKASHVVSTASCFSRLACQCGRPSFSDARNSQGAAATRRLFYELYGDLLGQSDFLKGECHRILERDLAADRWVRMPDWLVAIFPSLTWISMR